MNNKREMELNTFLFYCRNYYLLRGQKIINGKDRTMDKDKITYYSEKRMKMLKGRVKRCVCKYCGGELKIRQIVFSSQENARVECFCKKCNRIEFGVEPEIYNNAKYFIDKTKFNCFPELDENEKTKQMTIAKLCEIITWQNQNIGILTPEGYNIKLNLNEHYIGDYITYSDDEL